MGDSHAAVEALAFSPDGQTLHFGGDAGYRIGGSFVSGHYLRFAVDRVHATPMNTRAPRVTGDPRPAASRRAIRAAGRDTRPGTTIAGASASSRSPAPTRSNCCSPPPTSDSRCAARCKPTTHATAQSPTVTVAPGQSPISPEPRRPLQPIPDPTPEPTPSATPQPTPSATPQPTATATPNPTPEATATSAPTPTPSPAPTVTPAPATRSPSPAATPGAPGQPPQGRPLTLRPTLRGRRLTLRFNAGTRQTVRVIVRTTRAPRRVLAAETIRLTGRRQAVAMHLPRQARSVRIQVTSSDGAE